MYGFGCDLTTSKNIDEIRVPVADRLACENIQKRPGKFPLLVSSESEKKTLLFPS